MEAVNSAVAQTNLLKLRNRSTVSKHLLRGSTSVSCAKFTSNFPNYGLQKIVKKHNHSGSIKCSTEAYLHDLNFPQIASSTAEEKVGVLLLNLGGPETLNDVQPFLYNLFADPDIIRLPRFFRFLQRPLAKLISVVRAPKSKEGYAAIGGGSPLRRITDEQVHNLFSCSYFFPKGILRVNHFFPEGKISELKYWQNFILNLKLSLSFVILENFPVVDIIEFKLKKNQAEALKLALKDKDLNANVYVGMRYWKPFTEEALHQIKKDRITKLVVLPLYPQFSISTSGSSIRVLQSIIREDDYFSRLPISIIESWYQREGYIKSMSELIEIELQNFTKPEEVMIFFSAHGVPLSYVKDAGDPYRDQMEDCITLIMAELKSRGINNRHTLAYQSRVGPVQWLKPYTDEVIVELGQKGVKSLLAIPISFVSEHIETLEEIDMEYKHLALESGIENWGRVPALGCTSSFISDLADAVVEALPSASILDAKSSSTPTETEIDPLQYAISFLFGSFFALFLLLSPRVLSAFRNSLF